MTLSVLLVSPSFFGYEEDIIAAFEAAGASVDYFDERPSNSSLVRAALRVRPRLLSRITRRYHERILSYAEAIRYDLVLVIKGEVLTSDFMARLRAQQRSATFVYYTYDSIANNANCLNLFEYFDRRFSFDMSDVAARSDLAYKPLFYSQEFASRVPLAQRRYDAAFVGTLHSDRFSYVSELTDGLPASRVLVFFYVQAAWYFLVGRYLTKEFAGVSRNRVSFSKLSKKQVARIFGEAKAVLDIQRFGQAGLTMRTFEAIASGATLVTGNSAIVDEPFYDPGRVLVVHAESTLGAGRLAHFIAKASESDVVWPPHGFDGYSIQVWVREFIALADPRLRAAQ